MFNKDPDVVLEKSPLVIFDGKSDICMANNGNYTKHTRQISRIMHVVINDEEWKLHKTVWCEGGLKLEDIGNNNIRE